MIYKEKNNNYRVYSSFAAMHVNARDLRRLSQFDDLCVLIDESAVNLDVVMVSETWFSDFDANNYGIPNYNCIFSCRPKGGGGGVAAYVHSAVHLVSSETRCSDDGSVQIVQIRIRRPGFEGFIVGVYSRSRECYQTLFDHLDELIPTRGDLPIILLGDTNIDLLQNDGCKLEYCSFLSSKGLEPVVNVATRPNLRSDAQISGSCIDHIAIANCDNFIQVSPYVLETVFSDHYPVCISLTGNQSAMSLPKADLVKPERRSFNSHGYRRFIEQISGVDWLTVINSNDANEAFSLFNSKLYSIYDESFPLRRCDGTRTKRGSLWFTNELRSLRSFVSKLQKRYAYSRLEIDGQVYHSWLKTYKVRLRKARESHYDELFKALKDKPAKLWKVVNDLCGRKNRSSDVPASLISDNVVLSEPQQIVDALNEHFANVGLTTTSCLGRCRPSELSLMEPPYTGTGKFSLSPVEPHEFCNTVKKVKADFGNSSENVPSRLIADFAYILSIPLAAVFNLSVTSGVFPQELKVASVLPLYKGKGAKSEPGSYRPISLLSFLSKIYERLVKRQFECYLDKNNFFSSNQFGFRGGLSTELALSHIWHEVVSTAEQGECCLAAFLDVAKAFDCLDHSYFLEMLKRIECSDNCVNWFNSYLVGRTQSVRMGGLNSGTRKLSIGTPQGSVLGPFIFILYLNFVLRAIERDVGCRPVVYADDTTLLFRVSVSDGIIDALENVEGGIEKAISHFNRFGLVVNSAKTTIVLFHNPHRKLITKNLNMKIAGATIPFSPTVKCLGLLLHEHMKWTPHLQSISGKCTAVIASLARLRRTGADTSLLVQVYRALFEPVLTYGITLWGGSYDNVIRVAQVLQNDALRAIKGLPRDLSVSIWYSKLGILQVRRITALKQGILGYKVIKGYIAPSGPFDFIHHPSRSGRAIGTFRVPGSKLTVTDHSLSCRLPAVWNALPDSLKKAESISIFKTRFTELLLLEHTQ